VVSVRFLIVLSLVALTACSASRYLGDEYYYTDEAGVHWSCREPEPWPGGNCMVEAEWPDGGVDG